MAKTVQIRNFRGFESADLADCQRLNVVVGQNGSGKTALLEALFLVAGASPELALRARQWRGFESAQTSGTPRQIDQALWGDLFYNFDEKAKLSITMGGSPEHERSVKVRFVPQQEVLVPLPGRARDRESPKVETILQTAGVSFEWVGPFRRQTITIARLEDGKLRFSTALDTPIESAFFVSNSPYSVTETVNRFSTLSKRMDEIEAVKIFTNLFPNVEALSVEMAGGMPMLFAKVKGRADKIPLNLLSAGMTKFSAIIFAIPAIRDGLLLIDEIENGFYYGLLPALWEAIYSLADKYNVQVFATTHSLECLKAAAPVAHAHQSNVSLIRAEKDKDGASVLRQFTGSQFNAAIEADVEIR